MERLTNIERNGDEVSNQYTNIEHKLHAQSELNSGRRWVLISDIDDTIFCWGKNGACTPPGLVDHLQRRSIPIIYNTGRSLDSVIDLIKQGRIPVPDAVSTNLCGPLYTCQCEGESENDLSEEDFVEDLSFTEILRTQFEDGLINVDIPRVLSGIEKQFGVAIQIVSSESSSPYSVKFSYKLGVTDHDVDVVGLREAIGAIYPTFSDIYYQDWSDPDCNTWSVTCAPWGKNGVIEHLVQILNLNGGVIAGDSGNDIDALLVALVDADFLRVLVGREVPDTDLEGLRSRLCVGTERERVLFRESRESDKVFYVETMESRRHGPVSISRAMRMAEVRWQIQRMIHQA